MKNELIRRDYVVEIETRESSNLGTIEGVPIVYNKRANIGGLFDEIIESGALDKTNLNDVRLCLNHDTSFVYARSRHNRPNSTMRLQITPQGLEIAADLAIAESTRARDLYTAIRRGDFDKMSFMFSVDEEEWENLESNHPTRHIRAIGSVIEVSVVTFPAYSETEIHARDCEALENARAALENARQSRASEVDTAELLALEKAKFNLLLRR